MNISETFTNLTATIGFTRLGNKDLTAISVYICIVAGLGIIGNIMVIAAFYKYRTLRTSTNTFILHLAVCNLILALLDVSFSLPSSIKHKWVLGLSACRFYGLTYYFFCSVSLNTLAVISMDRYWVITKPSIGIKITIQRAVLCILVSYVYTTVFMTPVFLEWKSFHEEVFYTGCYLNFTDSSIRSLINALSLGVFLFAVPFAVMMFCYGSIFTSVRRKGRYAVRMRPKSCRSTNKWRFTIQRIPHWRTARMIIVVIFVFLLCWSPYVMVSLCMAFGTDITVLTLEITLLIAKSGVIYNPFIYAALNLRFRTAFFEMLHCHRIASRTNWGVKTRVLSGVTGDSSGYLTSRASGCPSTRGLGASLLRTIDNRSSIVIDPQKPNDTPEQEQLILEDGISFKQSEQSTENRESSSSVDEIRQMECPAFQPFNSPYCTHCLAKCQRGLRKCKQDEKRYRRCSIDNIKTAWKERNDKCHPSFKKGESYDRFTRSTKGKVSRGPGSSLVDHRTASLMEIDGDRSPKYKERQIHLRRGSLHVKHSYSGNSTELHVEGKNSEPMASKSCICECHRNGTPSAAKTKIATVLTSEDSRKHRKNHGDSPCLSKTMKKRETNPLGNIKDLSREVGKKGPNVSHLGKPTFVRRTSESIQRNPRIHNEITKNTESFWRRPSLVVMNNIRPMEFEQQNT